MAFPNHENPIAHLTQRLALPPISRAILTKLPEPELLIARWSGTPGAAFMPMPKTAVNKNRHARVPEDNIWAAWQVFTIRAVAITKGPQQRRHPLLWSSPRPWHGTHDLRPPLGRAG